MNCPACKYPESKVIEVHRWDTFDQRKHACKQCGYQYASVTMPIAMEHVLLAVARQCSEYHKFEKSRHKPISAVSETKKVDVEDE